MSLQTSVNVTVTLSAAAPSGPSFGGACVVAYHNVGGSARLLGPYQNVAAMVTAGFTGANNPVTLAAAKFFAQTPTPTTLYVGRRAIPFTQKWRLIPQSTTNGDTYLFTVGATNGVGGTQVSYLVTGSPLNDTIAAALATALGTAVGSGTSVATGVTGAKYVEWTSGTAGALIEFNNQSLAQFDFLEDTVDPGVATDLNAILAANPTAWYGLILDSTSRQEIEAAAAWVETNQKIFPAPSADTQPARIGFTADASAALPSAMYFVKNGAYSRTGVMLTAYSNLSYGGAAWLGRMLPTIPGNATWAYKTLATVQADNLPAGWDANVFSENGSVYTPLGGVNATQYGKTGNAEFLDLVVYIDWLKSTMQIAVLALLLNSTKVSFDDDGLNQVATVMRAVLKQGEANKGGVVGTSYVTPPLAATIGAADKAARNVPNIPWGQQLAGAVHTLTLNGTLTQ